MSADELMQSIIYISIQGLTNRCRRGDHHNVALILFSHANFDMALQTVLHISEAAEYSAWYSIATPMQKLTIYEEVYHKVTGDMS